MKRSNRRQQTREVNPPRPGKSMRQEFRRTKIAGGDLIDKLQAYRDRHAHALISSLGRLVASPFNSLMTIAVLSIALSLAGGFYLVMQNLQQLTGNLETSAQISLFLKHEVSEIHAQKLADSIRQTPNVQSVNIITKDQALDEFTTYSGFGAAISVLKTNPLPIVIEVLPKSPLADKGDMEALLKHFQQYVEVEFAQLDMKWVERLQSIMAVADRSAALLNGVLAFAVLFIAGNTIRLELHNRSEEVIIARLVGATNAFIQRPFLYTGFWIGLISGVAAWFIVTVMMLIVRQPVANLSELYGGGFQLLFFGFGETFALLAISSALGVFGSWVVLLYMLRYAKP